METVSSIEGNGALPFNDDSDSSSDDEINPKAKKKGKKVYFTPNFKFVGTTAEYNYDSWSEVTKYLKKRTSTSLDEKINKIRAERKKKQNKDPEENEGSDENESGSDGDDDDEEIISSSDEDTVPDKVRLKEKKRRKKNVKCVEEMITEEGPTEETRQFFEDAEPYDDAQTFQEMKLSRPLLKAVTSMNFIHPTPIQVATIPVALEGRDICGCAATGTGKTAAFMLPVLERLLFRPKQAPVTRVLIVLPTRELAVQVFQVSRQLSQFTNIEIGLAAGGLDIRTQEAVLRSNPDIVIATPGRLIDHLQNTPSFSLKNIEVLILDEADRMLDEYFAEQMKEVISQCSMTRQTMLFSATMTDKVKDLAAVSLKSPVKIFVNNNTDVAFNLHQEVIRIRANRESDREAIIAALVNRIFHDHTIVFMQTKKQTHHMHILLGLLGVRVGELHGDLTQAQRLETLKRFKEEAVDVMLATDLAARGLDIPGVKTVINFTMPATVQHYVHRVGRTARAGRSGRAITLVGEKERKQLKEIIKRAKRPVKARIVQPEVIAKYNDKIKKLEKDVERVMLEEQEEKELRITELKAHKATTIIKHHEEIMSRPKRTWFQSHNERVDERNRLRLDISDNVKSKKQKKQTKQTANTAEDRMAFELKKAQDYQARLAKRSRKGKRLNAVIEDEDRPKRRKKPMKRNVGKTSFDKELTDTSTKAVKKARYGPSYKERKEMGLVKTTKLPSKKFKSKSRYKRK